MKRGGLSQGGKIRFHRGKRALAAALCLAAALALLPGTALAADTEYEELEINASSLNGNAIWGMTEAWTSAVMLDDSAAFYAQKSDRNSGVGGLPTDGKLTMPSGVPYQLASGASTATAYDNNDCIRLTGAVTNARMNLQTVGVYDKIYVLATAGGPGTGSYARFQVQLHYTDGTTDTAEYKIYDWFDTGINATEAEMYKAVIRKMCSTYAYSPGANNYDGSTSGAPILQSAIIEADESRLLTSIDFNLLGKGGGGNDVHALYCGVFAVTGKTPQNVPAAPEATAATNLTQTGFTANWKAVTNATKYYLDVATDPHFTQYVTGYNNSDVGNVTSQAITGGSAGTTYYYRVRAYNASGQSLSSNRITVVTLTVPPVIQFTKHPEPQTTVVVKGSISGSLTVAATVTPGGGTPDYTWYYCNAQGAISGNPVGTGSRIAIPTNLTTLGNYYFRCRATYAGAAAVLSNMATVTLVNPSYTVTLPATRTGYTITPRSSSSVTSGGSYAFTLALDAAYSTSTVVVRANGTVITPVGGVYTIGDITADQTVTVEGVRLNTYTITASPTQLTFEKKSAGYATAPLAKTVTVQNTGNSPVTLTAPASTATYAVTPQSGFTDALAPNGTRTFTVQPIKAATQSANTYTGTFTVSTDHGTRASVGASFTVGTALSVSISGDLSIVAGRSTTLTANPANGIGPYSYRWSGGGITDTTQAVTVSPAKTTEYTVTVTDTGDSSKSASATVTVTAQSNSIAVTPESHSFGTARTGYAEPSAERQFTVTYSGNFFVTLNEPNVTNAAATACYTISDLSQKVLDGSNPTATFTVRPGPSLPAGTYNETLTVNTLLGAAGTTFTVSFTVSDTAAEPVITEHPADVTTAAGSTASFSVAATGEPAPAYQWQVNTGAGFSDIPGANGATYVTGNTAWDMSGYRYRCVVGNYTTKQNTVYSDPATLTLTLPMTITPRNTFVQGSAPANLTVAVGENTGVTFTGDFAAATLNGTEIFDGVEFDGADGSIVLRFRQEYLNTFAPGRYTLRVTAENGAYAEGVIIVTAPAPIPTTGDSSMPELWAGVLLLAGVGLLAGVAIRRRGKRQTR